MPFQADKDGKSNELIVLLDYGQTARLQTLLGAAGKAEATVTVRLIRKYNVARDDHAIFPETAWPTMQSQGYTQNINTTDWLGYVYPNTGSMPSRLSKKTCISARSASERLGSVGWLTLSRGNRLADLAKRRSCASKNCTCALLI